MTVPSMVWQDDAACRNLDPEMFFPVDSTGIGRPTKRSGYDVRAGWVRKALTVCFTCPVLFDCRTYADQKEPTLTQSHGIWGGETPRQRWRRRAFAERLQAKTEGA